MKFETKEELMKQGRNSIQQRHVSRQGMCINWFRIGINLAFDSIKERAEFYKKYRWEYELLAKEHPKVYKKSIIANDHHPPNELRTIQYNKWLFSYCFGDVA